MIETCLEGVVLQPPRVSQRCGCCISGSAGGRLRDARHRVRDGAHEAPLSVISDGSSTSWLGGLTLSVNGRAELEL